MYSTGLKVATRENHLGDLQNYKCFGSCSQKSWLSMGPGLGISILKVSPCDDTEEQNSRTTDMDPVVLKVWLSTGSISPLESLLEMQHFEPFTLDLLSQNLHLNKIRGNLYAQDGLRSTGVELCWACDLAFLTTSQVVLLAFTE